MPVVAELLNELKPHYILDAPAGRGWLPLMLQFEHEIDGVDLYETKLPAYRHYIEADLDQPFPKSISSYDAIVCCEGIEHFGNPLQFLKNAFQALNHEGVIIVTTPNTWYPGAKLKYFLNGFHPSFPPLVGHIEAGTHMHITPWSYPHVYTYLTLAGFHGIQLHDLPEEKKPKHTFERVFGWPQRAYCRQKERAAETSEQKQFWRDSGSDQSTLGRRLVVSARKRV